MEKLQELTEELRTVLAGRSQVVDTLIPPVVFVVANAVADSGIAMWSALAVAGLIALLRLRQGQSLLYALGGVGGVLLAMLIARWLGRAEGFFLPGIATGALTVLLCVVSALARRPLVAWTSFLTRRWPLEWYWHPEVRPAYSEVTWLWAIYFGVRLALQWFLFQGESASLLAVVQVVTGWPATILLLVLSYLYGTWRLGNLGGPSVEEFKAGSAPPWTSQRRGF